MSSKSDCQLSGVLASQPSPGSPVPEPRFAKKEKIVHFPINGPHHYSVEAPAFSRKIRTTHSHSLARRE